MSIDTAWKRLERRHAKRFHGGKRLWRPDYGESAPDGESPTECWDTKAYKRFAVITLFEKAEKRYREWTGKRHFHLCLYGTEQRGAGDFVLVRAERYAELVELERQSVLRAQRDDLAVCGNCHGWRRDKGCDFC